VSGRGSRLRGGFCATCRSPTPCHRSLPVESQRRIYSDYRWTDGSRTPVLSRQRCIPCSNPCKHGQGSSGRSVRDSLLARNGLATTQLRTGQQWTRRMLAPLQWIAVRGLRETASEALAAVIACRWLVNVTTAYHTAGRLVEKYNVESDVAARREYPLQDASLDQWGNRRLMALYPAAATFPRATSVRTHRAKSRASALAGFNDSQVVNSGCHAPRSSRWCR